MVREALKLLFLLVSYNFILHYISQYFSLPLFPSDAEGVLTLFAFSSALYLAWLTGYREKTVLWLAYLIFFQILGLALLRQNHEIVLEFGPSFLISIGLIWLFESPQEIRMKRLEEEKRRLEEEIDKNSLEVQKLREQIGLSQELIERLMRDKERVEAELRSIKENESVKREELEREKEKLSQRLEEAQKKLSEYMERLNSLSEVNRGLFEMLSEIQEKEPKGGKEELARLRQERKKLSKELIQLQELVEDFCKENERLNRKVEELMQSLEVERRTRQRLEVELENLRKETIGVKELYREVFEWLFENIETEDRALEEFIRLDRSLKREFIRELLLLDMKDRNERFEKLRGRDVFKLKPMGGRIYFTFGDKKRWKVLGFLEGEDDKVKDRYIRELLVKYKS